VKIDRLSGMGRKLLCKRSLYSIRSLTLSQWRDLRVIWVNLEILTMTQGRVFNLLELITLTFWKAVIETVTVVKLRMDNGGGNGI